MNRYKLIADRFALTAGAGEDIKSMSVGAESVPRGSSAANVFPWWETGAAFFANGWAVDTLGTVDFAWTFDTPLGITPNPRAAKNNRDFPIKLYEISFASAAYTAADDTVIPLLGAVQTRIRMPKYNIIDEWMPVMALQTQDDHLATGQLSSYSFVLPAPYYLQRGHFFRTYLRCNSAMYAGNEVCMSLRGFDPINNTPIVMTQNVVIPAVLSQQFEFVFNEDREATLRDMIITDISWGLTGLDGDTPRPIDIAGYFEVRFVPPTGPSWTESPWTNLAGIVEVTAARLNNANIYNPLVSMRPPVPHILNPGDEVRVDVRLSIPGNIAVVIPPIICWLVGTQEG